MNIKPKISELETEEALFKFINEKVNTLNIPRDISEIAYFTAIGALNTGKTSACALSIAMRFIESESRVYARR